MYLVELDALDVTFELERAAGMVLPELRRTGGEHEIDASLRVDDDESCVQRGVQVAILLVTGWAQVAKRANRPPVQRVFRDEPAGLRLAWNQHRLARVDERPDAADHDAVHDHERDLATGQRESAQARARREEDLHAAAAERRIGDNEGVVIGQIKGMRPENAPRFEHDLNDFPRGVIGGSHAENGMRPPVEDEPGAVRGQLADRQFREAPRNVGGQAFDRAERFDVDARCETQHRENREQRRTPAHASVCRDFLDGFQDVA